MDLIFKNKDGKDFFHRFDIDHTPRLRRMNVLQASSFEAVCDPVKRELEQPALKVAFSVFHTMRVEDNDQLTARDLALFYLMIAKIDPREYYSKEVEIGDERKIIRFLDREYSFPIALAASYLGERKDRLPRAVQALNSTLVSFDFRWGYAGPRRMKHPLMKCGIRGNDIAFTVPGFLIKQIALSRSYATVELNALARFKSKYTPRFYPNLARVAGYSFDSARKLAISPEALAKKVGYTWNGKFHLGHFKSRCLGPMLKDLRNRERVKAFDFTMTPDVDENGKSVLVFKPTRMKKTLQQIKMARLTDAERKELRASTVAPSAIEFEIPHPDLFARASSGLKCSPLVMKALWDKRVTAIVAKSDTQKISLKIFMINQQHGIRHAFAAWFSYLQNDDLGLAELREALEEIETNNDIEKDIEWAKSAAREALFPTKERPDPIGDALASMMANKQDEIPHLRQSFLRAKLSDPESMRQLSGLLPVFRTRG